MTADTRINIDNAFREIEQGIGQVSLAFASLDETLQSVLLLLVNPQDTSIGYVVYDLVSNSHERKIKLIQDLIKVKFNIFDPFTGKDKPKDKWPKDVAEILEICDEIKKVGSERNKYIHRVCTAWSGQGEDIRLEFRNLRDGHKNKLAVQKSNREEVTPETLNTLRDKIVMLDKNLWNLANKLLVKQD